jgi:aldose 1-epimerase
MGISVRTRTAKAGDQTGTVYTLTNGPATAEVWPFAGFNCVKWQIDGRDLIFAMPDWEQNPVPTRSGNPVLFPFPNRLAQGRLKCEGKTYSLPLTEATKTHAIHGFAPRRPWRVLGSGVTADTAFVTARFRMSEQFEDWRELWPGDGSLTLTYALSGTSLRVDAEVENFGDAPLPYGLGYHGYFRPATAPYETVAKWLFQCRTDSIWECDANIPTGRILPIPTDLNFTVERPLGDVAFDTLLTGLNPGPGVRTVATIRHPDYPGRLSIRADDTFPHLVLFIPAHRRAMAVEPYTCATNAANLNDPLPHGWRILAPGLKSSHRVEYHWDEN